MKTTIEQCFVFGSGCGLAETNKKEMQLQFSAPKKMCRESYGENAW